MKRLRAKILAVAAACIIFVGIPIAFSTSWSPESAAPVILVVGDFNSEDAFGASVERGIQVATEKSGGGLQLDVQKLSISETAIVGGATTPAWSLRSQLIDMIATRNVVAIISANTSQTADTVLEVGSRLNLPVLLAVATNDHLLGGGQFGFRLLAKDSLQAQAIADWCRKSEPEAAIGILYDPRTYGTALWKALSQQLDPLHVLTFPLGSSSDPAVALEIGARAGVRKWIVLGYREQAVEVLARKKRLKIPGAILLSDGGYGSWLRHLDDPDVVIAFPRSKPDLTAESHKSQRLDGYAPFGHDGYLIIRDALKEAHRMNKSRSELSNVIPSVAKSLSNRRILTERYDFGSGQENVALRFHVFEVGHGETP